MRKTFLIMQNPYLAVLPYQRGHLSKFDDFSATFHIFVFTPDASFASWRKPLDRAAIFTSLLCTVYPTETKCHLYGINVTYYSRHRLLCPVSSNPANLFLIRMFPGTIDTVPRASLCQVKRLLPSKI